MAWKLGVDIGGTFIDFCALDTKTNRICTLKVLTTPDDPGRELLEGINILAERDGVTPDEIGTFVHGTTVGINTIIQRKGAKLALITNAGFEDVIELARLRMSDMYSLMCSHPEQLISRDMVFGISGRMLSDRTEDEALDLTELPMIVEAARNSGAEGIIVALLHSYITPEHEAAVRDELARLAPDLFAFTSSGVWPVIREYERFTTAILNGYVHPRVSGYLGALEQALVDRNVPAKPLLTKSNGGLMNADEGKKSCVNMLLSGTASGVIGAAWLAKQAGENRILTLDIGGTSADIALIIDGTPQFGTGEVIGDFPLHIPSVSVSSIGIGGGSIASVDGFGVLKVGPESAGSTPGPACYGRGGTRATLTDAMAVCGYLGHAPMAYGQLSMDIELAQKAVGELAAELGRSTQETAQAILDIAVSELFVEVEKLVSRSGVDLRDFTLMPFGGGGPMLGCFLAKELGISRVMAPRRPGVVSALGGLVADIKGDFIRTVFAPCDDGTVKILQENLSDLRAEGDDWLRNKQGFDGPSQAVISADMRYGGQSFEIETPLQEAWIETGDMAAIRAAFHARHLEVYDLNDAAAEVELVNLRLVMIGVGEQVQMPASKSVSGAAVPDRNIAVFQDGKSRDVPLYLRENLLAGQALTGPAVIAQEDTTLAIPSGFKAQIDSHLNTQLTRVETTDV